MGGKVSTWNRVISLPIREKIEIYALAAKLNGREGRANEPTPMGSIVCPR